MYTVYADNPAGRLAALCQRFVEQEDDATAADAWARVLKATSGIELHRLLGMVVHLVDRTFSEVSELPESEDPDFLLAGIQPISHLPSALGVIAAQRVQQWKTDILPPTAIVGLEHCSRALRRASHPRPTLSEQALDDLLADVQEWIKDLAADSNLEHDIRAILLQRLLALQTAILSYQVAGFDGVEEAFESVVGAVITHGQGHTGFAERCWRTWEKIVRLAEGAVALTATSDLAIKAIEAGPHLPGIH